MNPGIEDFLEEAFASVKPTSETVGRVVVEPDYEAEVSTADSALLRNELIELLKNQNFDNQSPHLQDGLEVNIPKSYQHLPQYVRRITLYADRVEGDWIEVVPPGNWI